MRKRCSTARYPTLAFLLWIVVQLSGTGQSYYPVDSAAISASWFDQGNVHLISREWAPALQAYREAMRFASGDFQQAAIHQNLGSLYFLLTDYQKAAIHFEYAFYLLERKSFDQEQLTEICLNLGFTFVERGDSDRAWHWLDLAEKFSSPDSYLWQLRIALGTGNVLFSRGDYRQAMERYHRALARSIPVLPVSEEEVWLRKNLAWSYQALGLVDSARVALDQALDRIRMKGNRDSSHVPEILLQKGLLLNSSGDLSEALLALEKALDLVNWERSLPAGSDIESQPLNTMDVLMYRILYEKIKAEWRLSGMIDPDSLAIHQMYREVLLGLELGEKLAGNRLWRELIAMEPGIQRSLTGIALELGCLMDEENAQKIQMMVNLTERLTFFEDVCRSGDDLTSWKLPEPLRTCFHGWRKQLFKLHKLALMGEEASLRTEPGLVKKQVGTLGKLDSLDRLLPEEMRAHYSDDPGDPGSPDIPDHSRIHSLLRQDEALIKYLLCDSTLFTILLTTDTCIMVKRDVGDEIIQHVNGYIKALKVLDPPAFIHYSTRLYHQLIEPVEEFLVNRKLLQMIPDRQLPTFPFDALIPGDKMQPELSGNYLINHFETTCYTSLASWYKWRIKLPDPAECHNYEYDFGACAPEFSGGGLTALPHATHEVEKIARLFQSKNRKVMTLAGKDFRAEALLTLAGRSRIVHLATHGYRNPDYPECSGWMLPGDPAPSPHLQKPVNGLEIGALQAFHLGSDLLVLSTCSVVPESRRSWYKMTGFPTNFFRAGIHHLLYSLWDVSDKHTHQFMYAFYRNYLDGNSYSAALRAAKLEMLSTPETAFPTIWAVFVLWSE
ncbi:MAG: CHAT domain-containing protein [Bacteroidales bacterium]|nr:CHAT domain-containing protein [Bacteroidales bacterium]